MHQLLLFLLSVNRWLVLATLFYAVYISLNGYLAGSAFTQGSNFIRHVTATIVHIQLILGIFLYIISPVVRFGGPMVSSSLLVGEQTFFRVVHLSLVLVAVVLVTIGSSKAKRQKTDELKFKSMLIWYFVALVIISIAIPWPFSPLGNRPYFRMF